MKIRRKREIYHFFFPFLLGIFLIFIIIHSLKSQKFIKKRRKSLEEIDFCLSLRKINFPTYEQERSQKKH